MIALLLTLLVVSARAGDDDLRAAVQHQEAVVDALAAEVAAARDAGVSRQELGEKMSRYRAEAERLATMAAPLTQSAADAERRSHSEAGRRLADAIANDRADDGARAVLVAWLGEPASRVAILESVAEQASATTDPVVQRALALDLAEQAGALVLVCRYDAAKSGRDADRATAQATAFRARTAPGQPGGLDLVVAAERAERDAAKAKAAAEENAAFATRFEAVRIVGLTLSAGAP